MPRPSPPPPPPSSIDLLDALDAPFPAPAQPDPAAGVAASPPPNQGPGSLLDLTDEPPVPASQQPVQPGGLEAGQPATPGLVQYQHQQSSSGSTATRAGAAEQAPEGDEWTSLAAPPPAAVGPDPFVSLAASRAAGQKSGGQDNDGFDAFVEPPPPGSPEVAEQKQDQEQEQQRQEQQLHQLGIGGAPMRPEKAMALGVAPRKPKDPFADLSVL